MIRNMRDLGGIRTGDGRTIRHGMLVRSAQLNMAEESDLCGISTVIDLRTPMERLEAPDKTHGREYLPLPVFERLTAGISHEKAAENQPQIPEMTFLYRHLITDCAGSFHMILSAIMRHDFSTGAVLWHCTEGKDRCGLVTALIFEILGISREAVMADYLKTNEINLPKAAAVRAQLAASHGREIADRVYQAYIADNRYLQAAWDAMGEDYLAGRLGFPKRTLDTFRQTVLENS